ncbi:MAG: hypothetical protein Q8K92_22805, partial [Leadbetterella sp.]|nr:hypothetical protein [Leadbetterella sp.]
MNKTLGSQVMLSLLFVSFGAFLVGFIMSYVGSALPLLLVAGLILLFVSLKSPFPILALVVFLIPLGFFTMYSGATMNRYLSLILLIGVASDVFRKRLPFRWNKVVLSLGAWIVYALFSYLWSTTSNRLTENLFGYTLVFVLLFSTVYLVDSRQKLSWILGSFLVGQLIYVVIYFLTGRLDARGFYLPVIGTSQLSEYGTWVGVVIACYIPVVFYGKSPYRILGILV